MDLLFGFWSVTWIYICVLLQIRVPKGEPFFCEEYFNYPKNLLRNEKGPWMLKVLHGTIDAKKEPLFFRAFKEHFVELKDSMNV